MCICWQPIVDASPLPFQDELILYQVFTCNQSIDIRSTGFQDDSIDSWMRADRQPNHVSLLLLSSRPLDKNPARPLSSNASIFTFLDGHKPLSVKHAGPLSAKASVSALRDGSKPLSVKPARSLLTDTSISTSRYGSKPLSIMHSGSLLAKASVSTSRDGCKPLRKKSEPSQLTATNWPRTNWPQSNDFITCFRHWFHRSDFVTKWGFGQEGSGDSKNIFRIALPSQSALYAVSLFAVS